MAVSYWVASLLGDAVWRLNIAFGFHMPFFTNRQESTVDSRNEVYLMHVVRLILFIIALGLLLVSVRQFMNGYNDWQQAQSTEEAYRAEIRKLAAERDLLQQRVEMLKGDTLTKERLARKRLGYVKPGELKFKVVKPDAVE